MKIYYFRPLQQSDFCIKKLNYIFFVFNNQRYRFFFPGKSLGVTHSVKIEKSVFFFRKSGKKKTTFFFSQEKFMSHSLKCFWVPDFFFKEKLAWLVFSFFPANFWLDFCFFFSWKSLQITHSLTHLKLLGFFPAPEKKTGLLLTHSIFAKNPQKTNFSREIK